MTTLDRIPPFDPARLPAVLAHYLDAAPDRAARSGLATLFATDARVVDEGVEYRGRDQIRTWLSTVASAYTYTTRYRGQEEVDHDGWVIHTRLEGDFPGGIADLRYRVRVDGDLIAELVIAP